MSKKKKSKTNLLGEAKGFGGLLGGGANKPTEEEDSGFSKSKAQLLEILGEGVNEGLISGAKSIYLDKTPVQNANGKFNFTGFQFKERRGQSFQSVLKSYADEIASETSVGTEVKNGQPITRSIYNSDLDAIKVRISLQLQKYDSDGSIGQHDVKFSIFLKTGNGAFVKKVEKIVNAKYSAPKEQEYRIPINNQNGTIDQFQIRVTKDYNDSTSQKEIRNVTFQAYTEITEAKLNYANTALIGLQFDADQFSSVPTRAYDYGGILVQIPSNATEASDRGLNFSGEWDGTFKRATTAISDPVWHLYELLTNRRFGLGKYIARKKIDTASLYLASKYNNQRIDNGNGGLERRYQVNTVFETKAKVFEVINAFCSACNMKPYWAEGMLFFWQDRPPEVPGTITKQFTQADVENGDFVYSSTAIRARSTMAMITWNDPTDFYRQAVEPVEDPEGIAKYGIRELDLVAYGCTSRGQAIRAGKWALFSSRLETETVTFKARSYASYVRPGDIIQVADDKKANGRYGGLIKSATINSIELDSPVNVSSGATVSVLIAGNVHTRTITNFGNLSNINVSSSFPSVPQPESNWIISTNTVKPQLFRVLSVNLESDDPTLVEILAIEHNPGKYDAIEKDIILTKLPTRDTAPSVVNPPTNVVANYVVTIVNSIQQITLIGSWNSPRSGSNPDPFIVGYFVEYKRGDNGIWGSTVNTTVNEAQYTGVGLGTFYVRVASIDVNGKSSNWVESTGINVNTINKSMNFTQRLTAISA